ncbi:MAG: methyltransferase domain-containing protein [Beijerinckiaceae bacterium]
MMRSNESAIQSFAGAQPMSQAERTYVILRELVDLPTAGRVLEAGAGKGDFLGHFKTGLPEWSISAFEPSEAYEVLARNFTAEVTSRCDYQEFATEGHMYDLIVALGVLEHVENPLDMLRWGHSLLVEGGVFYIRVPHFANNPNDLFCADHLSKLTEETLHNLATTAGYEVVGSKEAGVPIFIALRKARVPTEVSSSAFEKNRTVLDKNTLLARNMIDAILKARESAAKNGERFAIFGLGSAGLFAPLFAPFPAEEITAYIDENRSIWGSQIHGRPVGGLDMITSMGIKHIALAISPVYSKQVSAKLEPFGVKIYSAAD